MFLYNDSNGVNSTVLWVIGSQGQNNTSVELSYEQILATMLIYIIYIKPTCILKFIVLKLYTNLNVILQ